MAISITNNDISRLEGHFGKTFFSYDSLNKILIGKLKFNAEVTNDKDINELIDIDYDIKIDLNTSYLGTGIPESREYLRSKKIDEHINPNGAFCLGEIYEVKVLYDSKVNELGYFGIKEYFDLYLIPFLTNVKFKAVKGFYPSGDRLHGILGSIQSLSEGKNTIESIIARYQKEDIKYLLSKKGHHSCLCRNGEGKKLRKCHTDLYKGIYFLKNLLK